MILSSPFPPVKITDALLKMCVCSDNTMEDKPFRVTHIGGESDSASGQGSEGGLPYYGLMSELKGLESRSDDMAEIRLKGEEGIYGVVYRGRGFHAGMTYSSEGCLVTQVYDQVFGEMTDLDFEVADLLNRMTDAERVWR